MPQDGEPIPPGLHLRCCTCEYELTGLTVHRCPECGEPFDPYETWLANEKASWKFHLKHVRTPGDYLLLAVQVLLGATAIVLMALAPLGWFALIFAVFGELFAFYGDLDRNKVRLVYVAMAIAWCLVLWWAHLSW